MIPLTLELIVTYVLFWFFLFYITKWMKEFKGASQKYYLFLTYYSGLGTMFGLAVLVSFGINTELMNALKLMGISIISNMILVVIETFVTTKLLRMDYAVEKIGMVSFFVVPVLGYRLLVLLEII
tara:strand:+ start:90 stop:464 length:375 start_codon:yes stop_codon:yes gene_type:complete